MKHVLLLFACLAALAQPISLPPAPRAQVITLTPEPGFHNEPSIAVNPRNPRQLVVAWQTNASIAYSHDAGAHWAMATDTAPSDYRISGDVSVTYDAEGQAILCYIAFDKLGTVSYWGHGATRNGVYIRRSPDGGATWEREPVAILAHRSEPGIPFEDKPYIVADNTDSPHRGNLYVGWTRFSLTESIILFSRSTDGGRHWSRPQRISTHAGLPRDDNGSVEGFTGAVDRSGNLYVVWADGNDIVLTSSRDGGGTFARSRAILHTAPPYFQVDGVSRANGFPQIGWSGCPTHASGCSPRQGVLYLTWSDYRHGDVDVFCATSTDGGRRWSAPARVNSDRLHNGSDQFFQWLALDPVTGSANVVFYDRRDDPANQKATVVLARSTDLGRTWRNYAWSGQSFTANDDFLGDYTGLAAWDGRVYGAWAEEAPPAAALPAAAPADGTTEAPDADETLSAKPQHRTVLRIGVADFSQQP